mmetsp:Transcript_53791/g.114844  ORF Transcript_53791/g.114844 Transcript_53791/m.114844 type:complete len:95 (+) Transcript_53791:2535-2819(+)
MAFPAFARGRLEVEGFREECKASSANKRTATMVSSSNAVGMHHNLTSIVEKSMLTEAAKTPVRMMDPTYEVLVAKEEMVSMIDAILRRRKKENK